MKYSILNKEGKNKGMLEFNKDMRDIKLHLWTSDNKLTMKIFGSITEVISDYFNLDLISHNKKNFKKRLSKLK